MSIARHHAEWLSLVEANGPFLSLQVLLDAFPQGLEAHDPEHYRLLKQAYQEWQNNHHDPAIHQTWIKWVLTQTLEYPDQILLQGQDIPQNLQLKITEYQETVRPDYVLISPSSTGFQPVNENDTGILPVSQEQPGKMPVLLVSVVAPDQGLEKTLKNSRWKVSPATRLTELLHGCNVRLGLLTNGEQWMLINAPKGETTGYISWYGNLWTEEKLTLRSLRSLLGVKRFFGVEQDQTLDKLLEKSKNSQQEVTDQLGFQVRKAVEVLVQKIDKIDQDLHRNLLKNITDGELYQAALFVMMRLVFLFSAEEKDLLLLGQNQIYDKNYAVSSLSAELREMADQWGEEILERRYDAWCRLIATFRAVYYGVNHDQLKLPAYGGDLFNPEKFPFLEGDQNQPLPIDNRTVLHLLEALQILQVKVPGGGSEPRRLSFRALDVEQIGHVYEGLLDHTAIRANSTVLGLIGTKNKEPEVSLNDLEMYLNQGEKELLNFLKKETGKSEAALKKLIPVHGESGVGSRESGQNLTPYQESRYLIACHNDTQLWQRIKPFYQLIRFDTFDFPLIIPEGSVYVTQGSDRRETGTHYTPKSLTC
jgi:hypothetical protein